jgi:hypothetical protein
MQQEALQQQRMRQQQSNKQPRCDMVHQQLLEKNMEHMEQKMQELLQTHKQQEEADAQRAAAAAGSRFCTWLQAAAICWFWVGCGTPAAAAEHAAASAAGCSSAFCSSSSSSSSGSSSRDQAAANARRRVQAAANARHRVQVAANARHRVQATANARRGPRSRGSSMWRNADTGSNNKSYMPLWAARCWTKEEWQQQQQGQQQGDIHVTVATLVESSTASSKSA